MLDEVKKKKSIIQVYQDDQISNGLTFCESSFHFIFCLFRFTILRRKKKRFSNSNLESDFYIRPVDKTYQQEHCIGHSELRQRSIK